MRRTLGIGACIAGIVTASCIDKALLPSAAPAKVHVTLGNAWAAQTNPAVASLLIRAGYRQTGGVWVTIAEQSSDLATAAQGLAIDVDITECRADPLKVPAGSSCPLYVSIVALNASSDVIDSLVAGPFAANATAQLAVNMGLGLADTAGIYFGDTVRVLPPPGADASATTTFASSDTSIATVSASGLVTSRTVGTVSITATAGTHTAVTRVRVAPMPSRALSVSTQHACALSADGVAYCWGLNFAGRLGTGDTLDRGVPTPVLTSERFVEISAFEGNTCALSTRFVVHCWGLNSSGQLGDGTTTRSLVPLTVAVPGQVRAVTVGNAFVCALTATGAAYCWGNGAVGKLGNGGTDNAASPTLVAGGLAFASINAGLVHACGVTPAGSGYCWGGNQFRNLGIGTNDASALIPTAVAGGIAFRDVIAGAATTCGLDLSGTAYCWGGNFNGSLGNGQTTMTTVSAPQLVVSAPQFASLAPGEANNIFAPVCGLTAAGEAWCWGANSRGQLGTTAALPDLCVGAGLTIPCTGTPTPVTTPLRLTVIRPGGDRTCAFTTDRRLACWGNNEQSQVGDGGTTDQPTPTVIGSAIRWP